MSEPKILRDAFDGWKTGSGLFATLALQGTMPWATSGIDSTTLNLAYFGNRSGGKFCAPLPQMLVDDDAGYILAADRVKLAKIIVAKYLVGWGHLWDTYEIDYDPTNSYDVTISRETVRAGSRENDNDKTLARTGTDTMAYGKTSGTADASFGFNSSEAVPTDTSDTTEGGSDVDTKNLLDTTAEDLVEATADEEMETISKQGNNGIYTKQRLIEEDRSLWIWNFFESVFKDLDSELTLKYFDPCRV